MGNKTYSQEHVQVQKQEMDDINSLTSVGQEECQCQNLTFNIKFYNSDIQAKTKKDQNILMVPSS